MNVYQRLIEERISELWRRREWYRSHLGWLIESKREDDHELRALVRLARRARREPDPITEAMAWMDWAQRRAVYR